MVPHVTTVAIPIIKGQETHEFMFTDSLQNEWVIHCCMVSMDMEISLELFNPGEGIYPVIGLYHLKSDTKDIKYDFTHLFSMNRPKCMGTIVYSYYVDQLYMNNTLEMKVDIQLMQQVFPYL